jgi:hypothetical protein
MTLDLDAPLSSVATAAKLSRPVRPRRLRRTPALRALARETRIHPSMLIAPLFVQPGAGRRDPIVSMPGQARLSPDLAAEEAARLADLGVGGVILFGLPESKDPLGSQASAAGSERSSCRSSRSPTRACASTPITATVAHSLRTGRSTTTPRSSASPRRRSPRREPAPTSSRRAR